MNCYKKDVTLIGHILFVLFLFALFRIIKKSQNSGNKSFFLLFLLYEGRIRLTDPPPHPGHRKLPDPAPVPEHCSFFVNPFFFNSVTSFHTVSS